MNYVIIENTGPLLHSHKRFRTANPYNLNVSTNRITNTSLHRRYRNFPVNPEIRARSRRTYVIPRPNISSPLGTLQNTGTLARLKSPRKKRKRTGRLYYYRPYPSLRAIHLQPAAARSDKPGNRSGQSISAKWLSTPARAPRDTCSFRARARDLGALACACCATLRAWWARKPRSRIENGRGSARRRHAACMC